MINLHESMGPDEQSALDLHCLFKRLHNISIDDKKHMIVLKGTATLIVSMFYQKELYEP